MPEILEVSARTEAKNDDLFVAEGGGGIDFSFRKATYPHQANPSLLCRVETRTNGPVSFPQVGGADNGGQLARGLDVPGTDKLSDYVHAVHKLPDNDHVSFSFWNSHARNPLPWSLATTPIFRMAMKSRGQLLLLEVILIGEPGLSPPPRFLLLF